MLIFVVSKGERGWELLISWGQFMGTLIQQQPQTRKEEIFETYFEKTYIFLRLALVGKAPFNHLE